MNTLPERSAAVTHSSGESVRRSAAFVRDLNRDRASLAFRVTLHLAGINQKQAAHVLECHRTTVTRQANGSADTPANRLRESLRRLEQKGAFPAPILADLIADAWTGCFAGRSLDELREMRKETHRHETEKQSAVDVWQMADSDDLPAEDEEAIDEAILGQVSFLLQIYMLRQEERLRVIR